MNAKEAKIELLFRGLRGTKWKIKSRRTSRYNCLAWAAREKHRKWDFLKGCYWPAGVARNHTIAALVNAFTAEGFVVCHKNVCNKYQDNYDTIVVYELNLMGEHAARLLHNEMWSSKLGNEEDIQHEKPEHLGGSIYGDPLVYMKRKRL